MPALTFNDIVSSVVSLSEEEQERLMQIVAKRRSEAWREELAAYVRKTRKDAQSGKLKSYSAAEAIALLESDWSKADE